MLRPALIAVIGLALFATALATAIAPALSATGQRPPKPTVYVVTPEKQCEKIPVRTVDGKRVTRLAPPAPGVTAVALAPRRIRVTWRFAASPSACRPAYITIGITRYGAVRATPSIAHQKVSSLTGAATLTYPSVYPTPDVAWADAVTQPRPYSSRIRLVLIRK